MENDQPQQTDAEICRIAELNRQSTDALNAINDELKKQPLVGPEASLCDPLASAPWVDLHGNALFEAKLRWIAAPADSKSPAGSPCFTRCRSVRRDGSCFYRSALFHLLSNVALEAAATSTPEPQQPSQAEDHAAVVPSHYDRLSAILKHSKPILKQFFGEFVEDFVDVTADIFTRAQSIGAAFGGSHSTGVTAAAICDAVIHGVTKDATELEYAISFVRYATSAFLREHALLFASFLPDLAIVEGFELEGIEQFCMSSVEVVGSECDQPQITAFCGFFQVDVDVVYVDNSVISGGSDDGSLAPCSVTQFSGTSVRDMVEAPVSKSSLTDSPITVLYRPGHFDILIA